MLRRCPPNGFGGTVTVVNNEPSSTVIVVVISPSEEVQTTRDCIGLIRRYHRSSRPCVVHCATHAQEKARSGGTQASRGGGGGRGAA